MRRMAMSTAWGLLQIRIMACFVLLTITCAPLYAADSSWSSNGNGNWGDSSNWPGGAIADGSGFTGTFNNVTATGTRTVTLDSNRTIGGLYFGSNLNSASAWIISGANILTLDGVTTPTITVNNTGTGAFTATISSVISGTAGLIKAGNGVLALTGSNTFTGGLYINGGRVDLLGNTAADYGLGAVGESVYLSNGGILNSPGDFGGGIVGTNRILNVGTGGGTLQVGGYSARTLAFNISGAGQLTLNASSSQITLTGSNSSFTGGFLINTGKVQIGASALPTAGGIKIGNNGSLLSAGAYSTVQGWLNSGQIDVTSAGAILLNSASENIDLTGYDNLMIGVNTSLSYTGVITPSGTTYRFGGGSNNQTMTLAIQNALTGARNLVIGNGSYTGGSQALLSNSNDFSGGTTITYGARLIVSNNNALGSGAVDITRGELQLRGNVNIGNNLTLNGASTSVTGLGNGLLHGYSGSNTYSGNITAPTSTEISTANTAGNSMTLSGTISNAVSLRFIAGDNNAFQGGNITVSGNIGGNGSIVKDGSATLALSGVNTYTGNTAVNKGTLLINGSVTGSAASTLTVASGAVLGGSGVFSGSSATISNGGALNIGSDNLTGGVLTFNSNLTLGATGTLTMNILGSNNYDSLILNGVSNTLSGKLVIDFSNSLWSAGTYSLDLFSGSGVYNLSTLASNLSYVNGGLVNSYSFDSSTGILTVVAIPEPSTYVLMGLGMALLALTGWRRRNC